MKKFTLIFSVALLFIAAASEGAFALNVVMDAQEIGPASTLSVDITTMAFPHTYPLSLDRQGGDLNIIELKDIVAEKSQEISILKNAEKLSVKTGLILQLGHMEYPPVSNDFAAKVEFKLYLDGFEKSFEAQPSVFIPEGGVNALDDNPASTNVLGVNASYDPNTKVLTFSLDPAKNFFVINGDSYLLIADVEPKSPAGGGGGCSTGASLIPLLAFMPLAIFLRKNRKR